MSDMSWNSALNVQVCRYSTIPFDLNGASGRKHSGWALKYVISRDVTSSHDRSADH